MDNIKTAMGFLIILSSIVVRIKYSQHLIKKHNENVRRLRQKARKKNTKVNQNIKKRKVS